jgi:hypothetical protein
MERLNRHRVNIKMGLHARTLRDPFIALCLKYNFVGHRPSATGKPVLNSKHYKLVFFISPPPPNRRLHQSQTKSIYSTLDLIAETEKAPTQGCHMALV